LKTQGLSGRAGRTITRADESCADRSRDRLPSTGAKRNVLKRFERVAVLKGRSQWKEGDRVTGLRKTRPPE